MISIKKFLNMPEREGARHRVIVSLLEGLSNHSVVGDPVEHEGFQADLQEILAELTPETPSDDLLVLAGRAVQALEEHTLRATAVMARQSEELRTIVEMLTRTISAIGVAHGKSAERLVVVQKDLNDTLGIDDVRVLKCKLSECLKGIEEEVEERTRETNVTVEALRKQVQNSRAVVASTGGEDPLTKLRTHSQAEQAIAEACRSSSQTYAVLLILDRVQLINDRFGRAIGDQALCTFKDFIMKDARSEDLFFRWGGPAFLALLRRKESIEWLRSTVARTVSRKFEMNVETTARNLMLSLSCHWAVFPMASAPRELIGEIEAFASAQTGSAALH